VVAQNSRSMTPFSFLRARRYRRATSLPTCCLSCIAGAKMLLLSLLFTQGCQYHGNLLSFHEDFFVMRRREFTMNSDDATRTLTSIGSRLY
jgi:hypothetical protein